MVLRLDHIAVSASSLDEGVAVVEAALGLPLSPGGKHGHMGTHNRLLNLGELYLEVIAIDPEAHAPSWPRWFDLDHFAGQPRLTNWICACDDLEGALADAPEGAGVPTQLARGDLRWRMAIPETGRLPFDEGYPALIEWQSQHPAPRLPDCGARLKMLQIVNPRADELASYLRISDPRVEIVQGDQPGLRAEILTPHGLRVLD